MFMPAKSPGVVEVMTTSPLCTCLWHAHLSLCLLALTSVSTSLASKFTQVHHSPTVFVCLSEIDKIRDLKSKNYLVVNVVHIALQFAHNVINTKINYGWLQPLWINKFCWTVCPADGWKLKARIFHRSCLNIAQRFMGHYKPYLNCPKGGI
jgi:hypothetical protein